MTAENCRLIIDKNSKNSLTTAMPGRAHKLLEQLLTLAAFGLFFMAANHQPCKQNDDNTGNDDQSQRMACIERPKITTVKKEAKQDDVKEIFHNFNRLIY